MAQIVGQKSFNSGEWAPQLYARVDLDKYHSGAALLENFFVDYRGGASTRQGTQYVLQCFDSTQAVRLIPFQASLEIGYVLEFGHQYIRFYHNGAPVVEDPITITNVTAANPGVVSAVNSYANGQWVFISGIVGTMSALNNKYYRIANRTGANFTLVDLHGNAISTVGLTYSSGGQARRVYTLVSPYDADDLALLKFSQNVTQMVICHPEYVPYSLTINAADDWVITPIAFGTSITAPTGLAAASTSGAGTGNANYSYTVTSVDVNGQESQAATAVALNTRQDMRTTSVTNTLTWNAVTGATSYNIYRSDIRTGNPVPAGVPYGFIGNATGTEFFDSNISPDYTQSPPISRDPFAPGAAVANVNITNPGSYNTTPTVSFSAPGGGGVTAAGSAVMTVVNETLNNPGTGYVVGDLLVFTGNIVIEVTSVGGGGEISAYQINNPGSLTGALPSNPVSPSSTSGSGIDALFSFDWGVQSIIMTNSGSGYGGAPTVTFSGAGGAAGTAILGPATAGNPTVPAFFQQRLVLAAPTNSPQTLYMSQPGSFQNYDVSFPLQDSDAITATLISGQLNNIKALIPVTAGLLVLSDGASWIINGGANGTAVTPATVVANAQSFIGANDVPPIMVNYDILFCQSRGSGVRDSSYNFYANVFTGTDISVLSSHLFFGYQILEWAWAEEPFKLVYAIRNDGTLLNLTFLKEQEFTAWSHSTSEGGAAPFTSVATIVEQRSGGPINSIYVVVERTFGLNTYKYIERFAERMFPNGVEDAWTVDSGLQYSGAPATSFSGGEHLRGKTVTGLADGQIITPFVMSANGNFTLSPAASKVTVGLDYTCRLKTLGLDLGEPTIQGKTKKINGVDVRVSETLGLRAGSSFSNLVPIKDLVRGNVSTMLTGQDSQVVTDLVSGDAWINLDPTWTVPGQYCFEQPDPYPATILGVFPSITVENAK